MIHLIQQDHYSDVIMSAITSQITSLTIVHSTVYSGADQRKYQSSASLAFVQGIHRWPVNTPHKGPVTRKMLPFDDVIMHDNITTKQSTLQRCLYSMGYTATSPRFLPHYAKCHHLDRHEIMGWCNDNLACCQLDHSHQYEIGWDPVKISVSSDRLPNLKAPT